MGFAMESQELKTFILHCFKENQMTKFSKNTKYPNFGPFLSIGQKWRTEIRTDGSTGGRTDDRPTERTNARTNELTPVKL